MLITDTIPVYAKRCSQRAAVVMNGKILSYQELNSQMTALGKWLQETQAKEMLPVKNRKLALLLPNCAEFLQAFLGAAMAGWPAVPLDPKWSSRELEETLFQCSPRFLVVDRTLLSRIGNLPSGTSVVVVGEDHGNGGGGKGGKFLKFPPIQEDREGEARRSLPQLQDVSDEMTFYMGFTSGTTGRPKGFMRSHRSWVQSFYGSNIEFDVHTEDAVLVPGSFVHSHFLYAALHTLFIGGTVYLLEKFSPGKVLDTIRRFPVSVLYVVPTMLEALAGEAGNGSGRWNCGSHVRSIISSGAKWSPASKEKIAALFPNARLYEFYGASELSFVTVLDPEANHSKPDSVGRAFHNVKISIRGAEGKEAAPGEIGKLYVKSDLVFSGYYENEEETKKVILGDGWATVGDFARRDEDGYIYLAGREKNMINYGGLNVFPEEVEQVLLQHPAVHQAVVAGVADEYWGERIVAVVRLNEGAHLSERELQAHCRILLAAYKCPREIRFVSSFPLTAGGKIARSLVTASLFSAAGGSGQQ